MAKSNHQTTVQNILQGQGLNVADSDIYAGPLHEKMGDACITIVESGGPGALNRMGSTESIQQPHVQVTIRNSDYTDGKSDADDVWALLQDSNPSGYSRSTMLQSSPNPLGKDSEGRHKWSVNVRLFIDE